MEEELDAEAFLLLLPDDSSSLRRVGGLLTSVKEEE